MKLKAILLTLILIVTNAYSQDLGQNRSDAIDAILSKYAKEYSIVGLSVGIVNNGESYTKSYGKTNLTDDYSISGNSLFHVASISKLFTATAIMRLVEAGKLTLEDRVMDVLPSFEMKDKRYRKIKIKHLLTHSSGLMWNSRLKSSPDDSTTTELYIQNLRKKKLNFEPGGDLSYDTYSNVGYNLLGAIVKKISGKNFDEYVEENILTPLKMEESTYYYEEVEASQLVIPQIVSGDSKKVNRLNLYGKDDKKNPIVNGSPLEVEAYPIYGEDYEDNPSGNLISSAKELNLWMQHNLDLYEDSDVEGILKPTTLREMWTTQKEIKGSTTSIGWGWWKYEDKELGSSVFHVGNNPGFCSMLMIYPERKFGITVLCNGWYAQEAVWNKITEEITKLFIGG